MAKQVSKNPLSPQDCDCLDRVLESGAATAELLARCQACGMPMEELIQQNKDDMELARKIKAEFFPDRM